MISLCISIMAFVISLISIICLVKCNKAYNSLFDDYMELSKDYTELLATQTRQLTEIALKDATIECQHECIRKLTKENNK